MRNLLGSTQIHDKWTCFDAIRFLEAVETVCKNVEIYENLWKSLKILDQYFTKINENSWFEHVKVTLCKIMWFSRPERFWPRSGNTLAQVPKFWRFWCENCSDPPKSTKVNAFWRNSLAGSDQDRMQKRWNLWTYVKIIENPRLVPYKNQRKFVFWARQANTLQNHMIFTPRALLATFR